MSKVNRHHQNDYFLEWKWKFWFICWNTFFVLQLRRGVSQQQIVIITVDIIYLFDKLCDNNFSTFWWIFLLGVELLIVLFLKNYIGIFMKFVFIFQSMKFMVVMHDWFCCEFFECYCGLKVIFIFKWGRAYMTSILKMWFFLKKIFFLGFWSSFVPQKNWTS